MIAGNEEWPDDRADRLGLELAKLAVYLNENFAEHLGDLTHIDNAVEHAILMLKQLEMMMPE